MVYKVVVSYNRETELVQVMDVADVLKDTDRIIFTDSTGDVIASFASNVVVYFERISRG